MLFGTFAEALAEGRGRAQAASRCGQPSPTCSAKLLTGVGDTWGHGARHGACRSGDEVLVETGDLIPADGEVDRRCRVSVNEAAITGESAPVIREAGGDRSAVTAGTRVISDRITVRVTAGTGSGISSTA